MNLLGDVLNIVPETDGGFHSIRMAVRQLAVTGRLPTRATGDKEAVKLLVELQGGGAWQDVDGSYELPHSWCWARFNQVAEIASNLVPPSKFMDVPHVAPDNIEKGTGRLLPYRTIREDGVTSGKHRFFPGQILYSKIRPNLSKAVTVDFEGLCSADMYPLSPRIDRGYLHLFLLSPVFLAQVVREDNRLAMPKVNQEQLSATVVAVPPLPEQKRIVAKVDQLMGLIDELEAKQSKKREVQTRFRTSALDALTRAEGQEELASAWKRVAGNFGVLFERVESVGDLRNVILSLAAEGRLVRPKTPVTPILPSGGSYDPDFVVPRHWAWSPLGQLCKFIDYRGRTPVKTEKGVPLITAKNVRMGYLRQEPREFIADADYESWMTRGLPRYGDVLFTTEAPLGNVAQLLTSEKVALAQRVITLRPVDAVEPAFLQTMLMSPPMQAAIRKQATGTTAMGIKAAKLKLIPFAAPGKVEQGEIVAKVEALMKLCDDLEARLWAKEKTASKLVEAVVKELVV